MTTPPRLARWRTRPCGPASRASERILAEALSRDDDDGENDDGENDDDDAGDANLRGETGSSVEATSRKKMADQALAYAAANSTAVNARGAVLADASAWFTAAPRARSRSATPSPERGGGGDDPGALATTMMTTARTSSSRSSRRERKTRVARGAGVRGSDGQARRRGDASTRGDGGAGPGL